MTTVVHDAPPGLDVGALEKLLGWHFTQPKLLLTALTHATYANENPGDGPDYERLEFLGDAVLDLLAGRLLFDQFADAQEGELSRRRARVVRRDTLARLAQRLKLGEHVRLGTGQMRMGGGASKRILADTFEALAGAVFLDGGYQAAMDCFGPHLLAGIEETGEPLDFKTRLQEACHVAGHAAPEYGVVSVDGPDHARQFTCEVRIGIHACGVGVGTNKKAAEQVCARLALAALPTLCLPAQGAP